MVESNISEEKSKMSWVNHMFTQWGQYIVHDIAHTPVVVEPSGADLDCNCESPNPECINIPIDQNDIQFKAEGKTCFSLPRSSPSPDKDCNFNQREQVNQISAAIDANTVYSVNPDLNEAQRDPNSDSGELLTSTNFQGSTHGDTLPETGQIKQKGTARCPAKLNTMADKGCFIAGDKRINENAGLAGMHTLFLREHNRVARQLKKINPHWSSDQVFDETRLIIIAMHQAITYKEYLPLLLGPTFMKRYDLDLVPHGYFYGYDASIDLSVSNEFTTAAFRFGHSMINNELSLPDIDWEGEIMPPIQMKSSQFNPNVYINETWNAIDPIMRGLTKDMSMDANVNFPSSMKDFLFAEKNKFGKDLFAINIQRGRDHGLRGYNDYRDFFGMQKASDFDELKEIPADIREKLRNIYTHVDDIDVYVGGLAETHVEGGLVGPLFAHMMAAQFRDLKRGDRFYFENGACETIFTPAQLDELKKVTLASLLCTCTDSTTVQRKPFHPPGRDNPRLSCGEIYHLEFSRWAEPYVNSNDQFGFQDSGSWTSWFPPVSQPLTLEIDVLQRERPGDLCLNTIASELRYVNDEPQVRFMCPAGEIIGSDFPPACLDRGDWTVWFDRSNPTGSDGSDVELISQIRHERPGELCEKPLYMQAQTTSEIPARETNDVFEVFDIERGLVCRGQHQHSGVCQDYRVRYFCPKGSMRDAVVEDRLIADQILMGEVYWTEFSSFNDPEEYGDVEYLLDYKNFMGDAGSCDHPLGIDVQTIDGIPASETGEVFKMLKPDKGFVCLNQDQTDGKCLDYKVRFLCPKHAERFPQTPEEIARARPVMANDASLGKTNTPVVESSIDTPVPPSVSENTPMIEPGELPIAYESRNEALGLATESCLRFGMCCTDYNDLNNILGNPMPVIGKKPAK